MKRHSIFPLILIIVCIFSAISGCTENNDKNNDGLNETSKEESQQIAENYVRDFDSYKTYNLTEPVLIETRTLNWTSCWEFVYKFDLISEKDPAVIDTATVTVTMTEGEVVDSVYAQGSRYKLGIPTGSMGADDLLEKPIYDTEIFVYGTVSELKNVPNLSFKLNWEGSMLGVEMKRPSTGLEDIENGDWVIVTGELKAGSEGENGSASVLLAKVVQTEDIPEDELFTGEVVKVDEEGMVVREIPGNSTAQTYRVRYEIREDDRVMESTEELFENTSPENPIEIRVNDLKVGSTYTIRVLIRNMEGRILCDAEYVGGFGEEGNIMD